MKEEEGDEDLFEALHPLAFAVKANAEDTPYFHEVMNGPDEDIVQVTQKTTANIGITS